MEMSRVPAACCDPKSPSLAPRTSELHTSQCWGFTGKCSHVQVNFTRGKDAWSFSVFPGCCCQWVLTQSRNSCGRPSISHIALAPPAALPHPSTTQTPGLPHVSSAENHLYNGFQRQSDGWMLTLGLGAL